MTTRRKSAAKKPRPTKRAAGAGGEVRRKGGAGRTGRSRLVAAGAAIRPSGIITLTSDFGLDDSYVAEMKGVLLSIAPSARLVDISHRVAPQDVMAAAFLLDRAAAWFPAGTVHLAVVDPGVGTPRRAIVARSRNHLFVGPDNGLFEPFFASGAILAVHEIRERRYALAVGPSVFDGRDRFAPAAALLSRGVDPASFGPLVKEPFRAPWPEPHSAGRDEIDGEVLFVDSFGSLVTNIRAEALRPGAMVSLEGREIGPVRAAYAEVDPGAPLALVGSAGRLEIAVREGRADVRLAAGRGSRVRVG